MDFPNLNFGLRIMVGINSYQKNRWYGAIDSVGIRIMIIVSLDNNTKVKYRSRDP